MLSTASRLMTSWLALSRWSKNEHEKHKSLIPISSPIFLSYLEELYKIGLEEKWERWSIPAVASPLLY